MNEQEKTDSTKSVKKYKLPKFLRILARIFLGILIFFVLVVLFVRSPWGQDIIVNKVTSYVSGKTNTTVEIDKLFITFTGDIALEGLFLDDKNGDTLVYAKALEADIPIWPLISGGDISIDAVELDGLRANFIRKDTINGFNFQFLADAFATEPDPNAKPTTTDSTSTQNIKLGDFDLTDIDVVFNDDVSGIESRYTFNQLELSLKETDLENMKFGASTLSLVDANIKVYQKPPLFISEEESPLPIFSVEQLILQNVKVDFQSSVERMIVDLNFGELLAEVPMVDLAATSYEVDSVELLNSVIIIKTETEVNAITEAVEDVKESVKEDIKAFNWPTIRLDIKDINFKNNSFTYTIGGAQPKPSQFNPNAIELDNMNLIADRFYIGENKAGIDLESIRLNELSGIDLKELSMNAQIDDNNLSVDNLRLAFNNNLVQGQLKMSYPTMNALIEAPDQSKLDVDVPRFRLDLKDIAKFSPELNNNPYFVALTKEYLSGNLDASGYLSDINLSRANINWGPNTEISAKGTINNATDPNALKFNISDVYAKTIKSDLSKFIDTTQLSFNLPKEIVAEGKISGSPSSIDTDLKITSSQGIATVVGQFNSGEKLSFNADIDIEEFQLQEFMNNDKLGPITITLDAKGEGKDINNLNAEVEAVVQKFQLNQYDIVDLKILGSIKDGKGIVSSKYKDQNINLDLQSYVILDSIAPEANIKLNLIGADLQSLGFSSRDIRTGFQLNADFKGDFSNYDITADIDEGVVVYDNKTYLIGDINATAHVRSDTTSIDLTNKLLDFKLQSNSDPQTFSTALQKHVYSYFYRDVTLSDTILRPVNVKFQGHISQAPILSDVFFVNLKDLDTINIHMDFAQKERRLSAEIEAPHINYSNVELDSLYFTMDTDREKFDFDLNFKKIGAGPIAIEKTEIVGEQINNELNLNFLAYHENEKMINIGTQITGNRNDLRLHVIPDSLIINKEKWSVPVDNEMRYLVDRLAFENFEFSRNQQSVIFNDDEPGFDHDHVAINFKNFKLSEFLNYLNPNEQLATGNLNGDLVLERPLTNMGVIADLTINDLGFMDVDMGTLQMHGRALGGNSYAFNMDIGGGEVELDLVGDYITENNKAKLDLNLRIQEIKMSALEGFTQGQIKEGSGSLSGGFKLNGTFSEPIYEGSLNFKDANFAIAMLNAPFTLSDETIRINNAGITMENFTIKDETGNSMVASGFIGTETYINPTFDLDLKAEKFKALDATEEDNDFVYGLAVFNADAKVTGDLQIPVIRGTAEVLEETHLTYIMPTASVNIEERDGIVIFVNKENPDAILTRSEEQIATVKGFDIKTFFSVNEGAAVKIIIDKETGDNFRVTGKGDFDFTMLPNGRMSLAGLYEISGGHYEMHLYNLVNRRFLLADGSTVRWSGDPFDAELDITAIYEIETSASGLMAARTAGSDVDDRTQFKQVLPFYVYLNVDGQLMAPEIAFALDMPEDEQGAIGGEVYGRVQEINNQEAELNKQVFSLLVLNKFYPEAGSDGSRGGFATIARDNLNDALSDQLNVFSDKLLGNSGVELDFHLDTFTDYQGESPTERTQLDIAAQKKLFDDRVVVRVGSEVDVQGQSATGEATPLIGNVSLEYVMTKDGRYRIRGFRRNEFENVIDGQTIVSGIALIFTQEFNRFSELWDALVKSQSEKEKQIEEEIKAAQEKLEKKDEELLEKQNDGDPEKDN